MAAEVNSPSGCGSVYLQKFKLYGNQTKFYMIGRDKSRMVWRVLTIDRAEVSELNITEDPTVYTKSECYDLLTRINKKSRSGGELKFITKCYGIIGFIKFLGPYYMLLITERKKIGTICGHIVYAVSKSEMIAVPNASSLSSVTHLKNENRYKKLLRTVDLTKDFFFSYSYPIMYSLQRNMVDKMKKVPYETMFVWNEYLTRGIWSNIKSTLWTIALVYGFFKQGKLSISGKEFTLTLIARRSRHFAGTRYLKRGVNEKGKAANDVETEQIVSEDMSGGMPMQISSVVQNRGSIPLSWTQESSWVNVKPDITLQKDETYKATRLHFDNLVNRYGNPIIILNLIKRSEKKPRESILREEFVKAINYINRDLADESRLKFSHWDLQEHFQRYSVKALTMLGEVVKNALNLTGIFHCRLPSSLRLDSALRLPVSVYGSQEKYGKNYYDSPFESPEDANHTDRPPTLQKGVLRTNCIDCLDRTNVAQYAYGLAALGHQLYALGFIDYQNIDLQSCLADELMFFYEKMGHTLALQYGGSGSHTKIFSETRGQWKAATFYQESLRTLQRYYNNSYTDFEKQDAINVFLGYFRPHLADAALWELDTDQHNNIGRRSLSFLDADMRSFKRSFSDGNLFEKDTSTSINDGERGEEDIQPLIPATPSPLLRNGELKSFSELMFDSPHYTNFCEFDTIFSSGNSFEDDNGRSPGANTPLGRLSTGNLEEKQSSAAKIAEAEFSKNFIDWVKNGHAFHY